MRAHRRGAPPCARARWTAATRSRTAGAVGQPPVQAVSCRHTGGPVPLCDSGVQVLYCRNEVEDGDGHDYGGTSAAVEETAVEEKIDDLETVLARFIASTSRILARMEAEGERRWEQAERERREFREQMARALNEAERDRQAIREEGERGRQAMMREINRCRGEVANKLGTVVEDFVAPSIRRLARDDLNCGDQESFSIRTYRYRDNDRAREREFDALYVGTRAVLLNETKTTALADYCREFAEFLRAEEFVRYFPELAGKPIVPVFSSLNIPENITTYLTRRGIYAVAMGDNAMQVLNREAVRSRRTR